MKNHLANEISPYLIQHAENPVDWYPWGQEAFEKAERENKPIFLSIGYSTCHWCHVMAHESFEDNKIAKLLNKFFVSIKVDREERPDVDSVYMKFCQAFTGGGGWPTSIFMTSEGKPFYAGTYFPRNSQRGMIGFEELLTAIAQQWKRDRESLTETAEHIADFCRDRVNKSGNRVSGDLPEKALKVLMQTFDHENGGFGAAPKFPMAANLLFLLLCGGRVGINMAEITLKQMYKGGIFDHIGGGFCRYSTDSIFLVPHFEKMLYDNGLLIMVYATACAITGEDFYRKVAERTADYVLREMRNESGGFFCAQDADSDGEEGKYYLFTPGEVIGVLGEKNGTNFNSIFDITEEGNFDGMSIPNLLKSGELLPYGDRVCEGDMETVYAYRKKRTSLHLDDKILTSWNAFMIAGLALLYRVSKQEKYLNAAQDAVSFIRRNLQDGDILYSSWRAGKRGASGFLDDYAFYIFALLELYEATFDRELLELAVKLCRRTISEFWDEKENGFWLYGKSGEELIIRPKDTPDGAIPSGNSVMAHNLVRMGFLVGTEFQEICDRQLRFMSREANEYPSDYCFFMGVLVGTELDLIKVVSDGRQSPLELAGKMPLNSLSKLIPVPTEEYPLLKDKTTYYICKGRTCLPPSNEI